MRSQRLRAARRTPRRKSRASSFVVLSAATLLLTAPLIGALGWIPDFNLDFRARETAAARLEANRIARIGFILFSSLDGGTCREYEFDNMNGSQRSFGVVDCETATREIMRNQAAARLKAFSGGFSSK